MQHRTDRPLRAVPDTMAGAHPSWCDPSQAGYDIHAMGPGHHASHPRTLLDVSGQPPVNAVIYVSPETGAQIVIGLNTTVSPGELRAFGAAAIALADEAEAA